MESIKLVVAIYIFTLFWVTNQIFNIDKIKFHTLSFRQKLLLIYAILFAPLTFTIFIIDKIFNKW